MATVTSPNEYCIATGCLTTVPCSVKFCSKHQQDIETVVGKVTTPKRIGDTTMSQKYPKYYKQLPVGVTELDVYAVCQLFPVQDNTGCINHARKKLLVPGTRTGGKSFYDDIKEARDTLTRWLELNPQA